jgi:hypothetical protein
METIIPIIPESHKVAADEELAKRHRGPGHEQYGLVLGVLIESDN